MTRAHKGWALGSVVLQNLITRHNKEDLTDSPPEGVYVHGLFLEGASLDRRNGKLIESKPKVLYEQMPVIYIYAINTTAGKDPRLYECPIYRKPQRTDLKYVGSIDFETDKQSQTLDFAWSCSALRYQISSNREGMMKKLHHGLFWPYVIPAPYSIR